MDYGKKIRQIRLQKELTQKDFAKKIDRSTRTIVRWEKQRNMPSLSGIEAISKALNVPISFFLNGENTYEPDTVSNGIKI